MPLQIESILSPYCHQSFNSHLPAPLNSPSAIFTLYARNGLHSIAKSTLSKHPQREEALVPAYSCGDEIFSLQSAGFNIKPYDIEEDFSISPDTINNCISPRTGLILITHFFGIPQPHISKITNIANNLHIPLVEDCAQCFPLDSAVGLHGNASVFSLRKFLPIPHGGVLIINDPTLSRPSFRHIPNSAVLSDLFIFLGMQNKYFPPGTSISEIYKQVNIHIENIHGPRLPNSGGYELGISNLAKFLIQNFNLDEIFRLRQSNLKALSQILAPNINLQIIPTNPNVLPAFLFIKVPNAVKLHKKLTQAGINFTQPVWSFKHNLVNWNNFPNSAKFKEEILGIKIDQNISPAQSQSLSLQLSYSNIY